MALLLGCLALQGAVEDAAPARRRASFIVEDDVEYAAGTPGAMLAQSRASRPFSQCLGGPCMPDNGGPKEQCGEPFTDAPMFHLMDQRGCGENDPNGPVFDPVHGVIHHFYQIHLSAAPGHGPDYGHFVSKDFVTWTNLPTAIWNGFDSSTDPLTETPYDNEAIFTGSAVVVEGAGPGGEGKGIVQIYPGLCNDQDWPGCKTGTLLAQAVPANYSGDELLTNWTKPSYNPIVENTQRDPSTPWKTPDGEWRLRTFDSMVYGAASDADLVAGKWYTIGKSADFRECECPSVYELPPPTPGFEDEYEAQRAAGALPTTVHKTSCGGDWWQLGTYVANGPKQLGNFSAAAGWEDLFAQRKVDQGQYYASKDYLYPTAGSDALRRINWGWATVPPQSTQSLPRVITFNALARTLEQAPIFELTALRESPAFDSKGFTVGAKSPVATNLPAGTARQSELLVTFALPTAATVLSVTMGASAAAPPTLVTKRMEHTDLAGGTDYNVTHLATTNRTLATDTCEAACHADAQCAAWTYVVRGAPQGTGDCCLKKEVECPQPSDACTSGAKQPTSKDDCGTADALACTLTFSSEAVQALARRDGNVDVPVACGDAKDTLTLTPKDASLSLRLFTDHTFVEAYFQSGRVAITKTASAASDADYFLSSSDADATVTSATVYPLKSIWVSEAEIRAQPRVYH